MTSVLLGFAADAPLVAIVAEHPRGKLSAFGHAYAERAFGSEPFLGFYDWLRTTTGTLVGFRLTIARDRENFAAVIPPRAYVVRHTADIVSVMFKRPDSDIDEEASTEQDFGETRAFMSDDGELVLSIDAAALSDEELAALARTTA